VAKTALEMLSSICRILVNLSRKKKVGFWLVRKVAVVFHAKNASTENVALNVKEEIMNFK
jgi:hypothetical protein